MTDTGECPESSPLGEVTHYFGKPMVAVVKCIREIKNGDAIRIKGNTTDFKMNVIGIRNEAEQEIEVCPPGEVCAFRTVEKARIGDKVFLCESETE